MYIYIYILVNHLNRNQLNQCHIQENQTLNNNLFIYSKQLKLNIQFEHFDTKYITKYNIYIYIHTHINDLI